MSVGKAARTATHSRDSLPQGRGPSAVIEWLWKEIRRFRRESDELRRKSQRQHSDDKKRIVDLEKEIADREKEIADREKKIAELEKKVDDLEHQLAAKNKDSTNSSKPPSSDGPAANKRVYPQRKKSRRKPGGQKGHPGKHRSLVPIEDVKQIVAVLPDGCEHCDRPFPKDIKRLRTEGEPGRHQVAELPKIRPDVTEFQCHHVVCPDCGKITTAPVPKEALNHFGPKLTAFISYLTVVCRMSRRCVEELLETALGTSISVGSIQKLVEQTSEAVADPYQELEQQLRKEPVLNADETGWRGNGKKRWLWVLVASLFVFYVVAKHRSAEVLRRLLGPEFLGILCTDRFSAYISYHKGKAQFCWAHLKRDLLGILKISKTTDADRFCRDALALHARLFRLWHRFRAGEIDRAQLSRKSIPLQEKFFALAERYLDSDDREVSTLAAAFFWHIERLFVFIDYPGVEPTNNISERAVRCAVQWRKTSFGNRSEQGEIATSRLLTATRTCVMQKRNALAYLAEAVRCLRSGLPAPSLLPSRS